MLIFSFQRLHCINPELSRWSIPQMCLFRKMLYSCRLFREIHAVGFKLNATAALMPRVFYRLKILLHMISSLFSSIPYDVSLHKPAFVKRPWGRMHRPTRALPRSDAGGIPHPYRQPSARTHDSRGLTGRMPHSGGERARDRASALAGRTHGRLF